MGLVDHQVVLELLRQFGDDLFEFVHPLVYTLSDELLLLIHVAHYLEILLPLLLCGRPLCLQQGVHFLLQSLHVAQTVLCHLIEQSLQVLVTLESTLPLHADHVCHLLLNGSLSGLERVELFGVLFLVEQSVLSDALVGLLVARSPVLYLLL